MRTALHEFVDRIGDDASRLLARGVDAAERGGELVGCGVRWLRSGMRCDPLPRRPLVAVAVAVAVGCVAGPGVAGVGTTGTATTAVILWWLLGAVACCAWAVVFRVRHEAAAWLLLAAVAVAAAGWAVARARLFRADDIAWSLAESPTPIAIEGQVVMSPRRLPTPPASVVGGPAIGPSSECVVAIDRVRAGAAWKRASGRVAVVVTGDSPDVVCGSRVRVLGRGFRPGHALNPGEFDFRDRAQTQRCLSIVRCSSPDCVREIRPPPAWSAAAWLDRLRIAGATTLARHVGDHAGLAAALLLGSREALPGDDSHDYLVTGTIHVLSISGLHVGILAFGLFKVLRTVALSRAWALAVVAAGTGLYMVLVGAETPVVRATLLVWLSCLGAALGRRSAALNALAVAAIVVLVWHPPEVFRVGTQLSFLSTAVLVGAGAFAPSLAASDDPIERLIDGSRSPLERRLRRYGRRAIGVVVTGAVIWVVTAPIVATNFHVVSPVGLGLNPLIAPLVPVAMAWGFLCLLVAPLSSWLAGWCGGACDVTLGFVQWLVARAAMMPMAYAWVGGPQPWWTAGAYVWLVTCLVTLPRERLVRLGTWAAAAALWIGIGVTGAVATSRFQPQPRQLEVTVAALGHGCGIVVRSPDERILVYDAGRLGAPGAARRGMSAVLWSGGISRIDTLVISHADTDHFNAVPDLLERFAVGELAVSESFLRSESAAARQVLRLVHERRIPVRCVGAGDEIPCGPLCRARVLHQDVSARADNETSLVLAIESAGRRVLLTGDLEGAAAVDFVAGDPDGCDVLLAPHHGSVTSLPPDVARATRPDWVVVSGPGGSRWPEVERAYATARGSPTRVIKTGGSEGGVGGRGAVRLTLSASGVAVQQFNEGRWSDVSPAVGPLRPVRAL